MDVGVGKGWIDVGRTVVCSSWRMLHGEKGDQIM
jgi:hypothetical protein